MTEPAHPLPTSGGSYVRNADGSLAPAPQAEPKSTKGAKTAPKEA